MRQILQQDAATRSLWKASWSFSLPTPLVRLNIKKEQPDPENLFSLIGPATEAVSGLTGSFREYWNPYCRGELELTMGYLTILRGWDVSHVDIAAMKAEVHDPDEGRMLIALFGSASNYRARRPGRDELPEIPSDADGLYGIFERTREPGDPRIVESELDRDIGHDPASRVDTAWRFLCGERFTGFREDRYEVLIQSFCSAENIGPYNRVVLGAPVWVGTPAPTPFVGGQRSLRRPKRF